MYIDLESIKLGVGLKTCFISLSSQLGLFECVSALDCSFLPLSLCLSLLMQILFE